MEDQALKDDFTAFCVKYLGPIIIWGGLILGSFLGWNLANAIVQTSVSSANAERSITNQAALDRHISQEMQLGKENQETLSQIKTDIAVIKQKLEPL